MKRLSRAHALILVLALAVSCLAQEVEIENVPQDALKDVELGAFARTYALNGSMNPFYLRGDFDGDGKPDYAFWIKATGTGAVGIAFRLSSQRMVVVVGAGTPFKISGGRVTDLSFLNTWEVFGKTQVEPGVGAGPAPKLLGEAILAGKRESASGLIYWNGKTFSWYQQGD